MHVLNVSAQGLGIDRFELTIRTLGQIGVDLGFRSDETSV